MYIKEYSICIIMVCLNNKQRHIKLHLINVPWLSPIEQSYINIINFLLHNNNGGINLFYTANIICKYDYRNHIIVVIQGPNSLFSIGVEVVKGFDLSCPFRVSLPRVEVSSGLGRGLWAEASVGRRLRIPCPWQVLVYTYPRPRFIFYCHLKDHFQQFKSNLDTLHVSYLNPTKSKLITQLLV